MPIKKVTTLTYQDFQPENLVGGGGYAFLLIRTEVESFL